MTTKKKFLRVLLLSAWLLAAICLIVASKAFAAPAAYAKDRATDGRIVENFDALPLGEPPTANDFTVPCDDSRTIAFKNGVQCNGGTRILQDDTGNRMLRLGGEYSNASGLDKNNVFGTRSLDGFTSVITVKVDFCVPLLSRDEYLNVNMYVGGTKSANNRGALFSIQSDGEKNVLTAPNLADFAPTELPLNAWFTIQAEIDAAENGVTMFLFTADGEGERCTRVAASLHFADDTAEKISAQGITYLRFGSALQHVKNGEGTPRCIWIDNLAVMPDYYRLARKVAIDGNDAVGTELTGKYFYGYGEESHTRYQWYRADPKANTSYANLDYVAIEGATSSAYTVTESDEGKYLRFEVIPESDGIVGVAACNADYFAVANRTVRFDDESDLQKSVAASGDGITASVDGSLILTPQPDAQSVRFTIQNTVAYRGVRRWEVSVRVDELQADARLLGYIGAALPGESDADVLCFALQGDALTVGDYTRKPVRIGQWLTISTVLTDNGHYYVEAFDPEGERVFFGPSQRIENETFLRTCLSRGVTFARCVYTAQNAAAAPAMKLDDWQASEGASEYLTVTSAALHEVGEGDELQYTFDADTSSSSSVAYKVSEGELPVGVTLTESGLQGVPETAGDYAFSIDAACDGLTARAAYTLHVFAYYTVSFQTFGGTQTGSRSVKENTYLSAVEDPQRENSRFTGWYADAAFTQAVTPSNVPITADTTFYARWLDAVTVTFATNGGSAVAMQRTYPGDVPHCPDSRKEGYLFLGWCKDQACTDFWNEKTDAAPANDFTLYAKWAAKVYSVTFIGASDSVTMVTVEHGGTIAAPDTGAAVAGWYTDEQCTCPWEFGKAVTGNLELYAKLSASGESAKGKGCGSAVSAALPFGVVLLLSGAAMLCKQKRKYKTH